MGKKIIQLTESQFKNLTMSLMNEAPTKPVQVTVKYKFKSSYPVNSTDPKSFLKQFSDGILAEINKTPEGQQMLKSGQMTLSFGKITAGASNTWGGKATAYDKENNYVTDGPTGQDYGSQLYKSNVDLAYRRAVDFRKYLFNILKTSKISDSTSANVTYNTMVVNTGGVKDEAVTDKSKYPNPGQYIEVNLRFMYSKDIIPSTETVPTESDSSLSLTEIKPGFVITGSYFCDGRNSELSPGMDDTYVSQCSQLPEFKNFQEVKRNNRTIDKTVQARLHNRISAFEIKWNANTSGIKYTRPVLRWTFTWSPQGKIVRVERYLYNKEYYKTKDMAPRQNVMANDPELLYFMGINQNEPQTGGPYYERFVKRYL
jgi:hypothetical protein